MLTGAMFAVVLVSLGAILACRSGRRRERLKRNIKEQQEREQQEYLQVSQASSPQPRARPQSQPWEIDARNRVKSIVELEGDEACRTVELADMRHEV